MFSIKKKSPEVIHVCVHLTVQDLSFCIDLNLLDWSANNHVALSLNNAVYLWNAGNGAITQLLELENPDEYVAAVSWIKEGNILAVGSSVGSVQVLAYFESAYFCK